MLLILHITGKFYFRVVNFFKVKNTYKYLKCPSQKSQAQIFNITVPEAGK
jgi:hypothetical protein